MAATSSRPSDKALGRWYDEQPTGDRPCSDCGRIGPKHYVQPQHPYYAGGAEGVSRCGGCIGKLNLEARARRKAQLAKEPRCESCGRARLAWTVCGVGLCGRCKTRALRTLNGRAAQGGFLGAMLYRPGREEVLAAGRNNRNGAGH